MESEGKTQGFVIELKYPLESFAVFMRLLGTGHEDCREEAVLELGNREGAEEEFWAFKREEEEEEVCSIF